MQIDSILTGIAVREIEAALDYYERLFGAPPDDRPMSTVAEWHLPAGVVQLVADPDRAGRSVVTLVVDDLDATLDELSGRGITATTVGTQSSAPGGLAVLADPEGTMLTLVTVQAT